MPLSSPETWLAAPFRTGAEVVRLFESLAAAEAARLRPPEALALQPVGELLARVGHPERRLRVIHIAGSKGKGSTALLCEAILGAAGLRVGTFTSPHLERWSERFRIAGREVSEGALVMAAERIRPHLAVLLRAACPPGFFDVATAIAFVLFEQSGVDVAVIEVGLGGRIDATNVVHPVVSCVTSIELEHTERLGGSLAAIAREKAGVVKAGVPVITGALPAAAADVVRARATALDAPLRRLGHEFDVRLGRASPEGLLLHLESGALAFEARLPVLGPHLAGNAAMALACVQQAALVPRSRLAEAARRGFAMATLPGRTEILGRRPWVVADGAHTESSASALVCALDTLACRERHMVLSISAGKDLRRLLPILLAGASALTVTRAEPNRSAEPEAIAACAAGCFPGLPVRIVADPLAAVRNTLAQLPADALMCVTGSVYAAGAARAGLALALGSRG